MKFIILFSLIFLPLMRDAQANEISLIEHDILPKGNSEKETSVVTTEEDVLENAQEESHNQDFEDMNDFIHTENEKLKDIRLLNLDLEKYNLEFKKKEIEQKMAQLNKLENPMIPSNQENIAGSKMVKPVLKLKSIFENEAKKQAMLSINGININVKQGEKVSGVTIKIISPQLVAVEYEDGDTQELHLS